jgi:hypothetical protein
MSDKPNASRRSGMPRTQPDAFEKSSEDEDHNAAEEASGKLPADFDELPIELVSLTDR